MIGSAVVVKPTDSGCEVSFDLDHGKPYNLIPEDQVICSDTHGHQAFAVQCLGRGGEGVASIERPTIEVMTCIRCPAFGFVGGQLHLSFDVEVNPDFRYSHSFTGDAALDFLREQDVRDVADLNGRLCWAELRAGDLRYVRFLRMITELEDEEEDED